MKRLLSYTLFILTICLLISCDKDFEDFSNVALIPSEIKEEYQTFGDYEIIWVEKFTVYEYDIKGRFLSIIASTYNNGKWGNTRNVSFTYDNESRLVSREIHLATDTLETFQTTHYQYVGNEVQIWSNQILIGVVVLQEDQDTPARYTTYHQSIQHQSDQETYRYINEYQYKYDTNGNIIEKSYAYMGDKRIPALSKDVYEYDNRNAFYKHVNMPLWYKISEGTLFLNNNPVKRNTKEIDGDSINPWEVYEHTYNKEGYPTQIVHKLSPEIYEDALATIYTISYISAYN